MAAKTKIMSDIPPIMAKHELFSKYEYCPHKRTPGAHFLRNSNKCAPALSSSFSKICEHQMRESKKWKNRASRFMARSRRREGREEGARESENHAVWACMRARRHAGTKECRHVCTQAEQYLGRQADRDPHGDGHGADPEGHAQQYRHRGPKPPKVRAEHRQDAALDHGLVEFASLSMRKEAAKRGSRR
jgi:hypothetical protein